MQSEISRRTPLASLCERHQESGSLPEKHTLALLRRWFWTRKPDAGFALSGFPATLLQAKVFDEWLETREETLTGVFGLYGPVVEHYRTLGLLQESSFLSP